MNKTKPTDFARALSNYLFEYLPTQRGLSENTIKSYSDSLSLFLNFCESELHMKRERIEIKDFKREIVEDFLTWLERSKNNSIATRNQRRIALNTFFKYVQYENPGYVLLCQQIISIPHKTDKKQTIHHLPIASIEEILKKPNLNLRSGRRDFALLSLMYETAARISEIAGLCIGDIRFERDGATIHLFGKGKKSREVPIIGAISSFLKKYLEEETHYRPCLKDDPLFCNRVKEKLTRAGITYVFDKYVYEARATAPELIPRRVYPHIFRHSRAMHWLEAGVDLQYIKDLLGHVELSTTEVYAQLNTEMKRKILEQAHPVDKQTTSYPTWNEDRGLMDWINGFGKKK